MAQLQDVMSAIAKMEKREGLETEKPRAKLPRKVQEYKSRMECLVGKGTVVMSPNKLSLPTRNWRDCWT